MKKILFIALAIVALAISAHGATHTERARGVLDSLMDGAATVEQQLTIADAFVSNHKAEIEAAGFDTESLTNEQKARVFVIFLKRHVKRIVKASNPGVKTANETAETARLAIGAAITEAETSAETDLPDEVDPPLPTE